MYGRKIIYTDAEVINDANVVEVLKAAFEVHTQNRADIEYLYRYYKGDQPIVYREKDVRPEIKNIVVENRANEIVSFKSGYLMGEPIQYINISDDEKISEKITTLNEYMRSENKANRDSELSEWFHICGQAYRMVLPDVNAGVDEDEAPFEIYTLDPRDTFVVHRNVLGSPVCMAVNYCVQNRPEGTVNIFSIYTDDWFYEIENGAGGWTITKSLPQVLGIPIVEYPLNKARLGAFEIVITLLDAINTTEANRVDGVEQFVQALLLFHNVKITPEQYEQLRQEGGIQFQDIDEKTKGEITYLISELNQTQTQVLVDHMYDTVLTICGMPNRNGGSSTSDTGTAVIYRDGWSAAESRAKATESIFKESEMVFLKLVLRICRDLGELELKPSSVDIRFTRRNHENIEAKANVLTTMLNNPKIDPKLAFIYCGMFSDPNVAYQMSMEYAAEQEAKMLKQQEMQSAMNNPVEPDNKPKEPET